MHCWIISPNVTQVANEEPIWKKVIVENNVAIMGWDEDHSLGSKFVNDIQQGDIILVAQGANRQKRLFIGGIAEAEKATYEQIENAPSERWCRKLNPVLTKEELEKLDLDFNGTAYGEADRIPALYVLHPEKNLADKKLFNALSSAVKMKQNNSMSNNIKEEFITWFIKNDGNDNHHFSDYFGSSREKLSSSLDEYAAFFKPQDIFDVTRSNYREVITSLRDAAYKSNRAFLAYSEPKSNHLPRAILGKDNYLKFLNEKFTGEVAGTVKSDSKDIIPLNVILYGPPGTGKTFSTINKALEIVDHEFYVRNSAPEKRKELTERFKELLFNYDTDEGQIGFITFHQSMSYEDFIEGIKPIKPELTNNVALYDVEDGLFKRLCLAAQSKEGNFNEKIEWLQNKCSELESKPAIKVETPGSTFSCSYRGGTTFVIKPESSQNEVTDYRASIENIRKIYEGGLRTEVYNPTYVVGLLNYLYKNGLKRYAEIEDEAKKPFVLIIDEINRGNISQIFGELITLIEEDKRLGKDEMLEVTLPYSKEKFGVPPNLYIIGTMNTADRSVEALDTALRRRFCFEELMPNPELLRYVKVGTLSMMDILSKINERIEVLVDRDHTIGHSFFLKLKNPDNLRDAFRDKIIPLLQEYFYGDYGKIGLVLGKGFVEVLKQEKGKFADIAYDGKEEFMSVKYRLKTIGAEFPVIEAVTELLTDK